MLWVEAVAILALLQFIGFGVSVARARGRHGIKAPATTGNPIFERHYRVQMNTLELLPALLAGLWLASRHWPGVPVAIVGAVYLVGRQIYHRAYIRDPGSRTLGFSLSLVPILVLLLMALVGVLLAALR